MDYLRRTPRAGDTADGITRWWLGAPAEALPQVAAALDGLVREGLVERWVAPDGREQYRIGPALLGQMQRQQHR